MERRKFDLMFDRNCDNPKVRVASEKVRIQRNEDIRVIEIRPGDIWLSADEAEKVREALQHQPCDPVGGYLDDCKTCSAIEILDRAKGG